MADVTTSLARLRRFLRLMRPFRLYVWWLFVLSLLQVPISLVSPLLIKTVVDDAVAAVSLERMYRLAALLAGLAVFNVVLGVAGGYCNLLFRIRAMHRVRMRLYRHLQSLPLRYFDRHETGYLMSRQLDDVANLGGVMPDTFVAVGINGIKALALAGMLLFLEWRLAIGAFVFALLLFGFQHLISGGLRRRSLATQERWSRVNEALHQAISAHLLVKTSASERTERRRFAGVLRRSIEARIDHDRYQLVTGNAFELISKLARPMMILAGAYLIVTTGFTIGDFFAFFLFLQGLISAVGAIAGLNPRLQSSLASLERVFEVLDAEPERPSGRLPGPAPDLGARGASLRFEHVGFAYETGRPVLHDVSFDVPGHSMVALVGPSGAGKTTIARLIPRLYTPTSGRILVGGMAIEDLDLSSYRRQIGVVSQETFLFDRTVADNIAQGRPNASREAIREAADAANATSFIEALDDGFDTVVGERGVRISGGQRQRLAIARELLRDPSVLILDEATSALDSESEALVQEALSRLLKNRTSVVIAHRLSTIMRADTILVLEGGRLIDNGTHDALLARCDLYQRLYELQFAAAHDSDANGPR